MGQDKETAGPRAGAGGRRPRSRGRAAVLAGGACAAALAGLLAGALAALAVLAPGRMLPLGAAAAVGVLGGLGRPARAARRARQALIETQPLPAAGLSRGPGPGTVRPPRRLRGLRLRRWLPAGVAGLAGFALAAAGTAWAVTPGVSGAEALIRAAGRAQGAPDTGAPVPARFAAALTAAENARFYRDDGIDPAGVARALAREVTGAPGDPGGATLEQQLARVLYPAGGGWPAVVDEAVLAVKLDAAYPKARILEMYASAVYFGNGYYGLTAAACGYFATAPSRLDWAQAALLAGVLQAPSFDDPLVNPAAALARRRYVLTRLAADGTLTAAQAASAARAPLSLRAETMPARC